MAEVRYIKEGTNMRYMNGRCIRCDFMDTVTCIKLVIHE